MTIEHALPFFAWNISSWLLSALVIAFLIVAIDKFILNIKAKNDASSEDDVNSKNKFLLKKVIYFLCFLKTSKYQNYQNRPKIVQWAIEFYPVLLLVFLLRGFMFEPFKIPSNSMMPTLLTGDFVLVNKSSYAIKLPVINTKIIDIKEPKNGDIIVFRYPNYEKSQKYRGTDFVKRIIGIPGDEIIYYYDHLKINGKKILYKDLGAYKGVESGIKMTGFKHKLELLENAHGILLDPERHSRNILPAIKIPNEHYLVMGDNRARSSDSRFWGFVPKKYILGKVVAIWFNWDESFNLSRIGSVK